MTCDPRPSLSGEGRCQFRSRTGRGRQVQDGRKEARPEYSGPGDMAGGLQGGHGTPPHQYPRFQRIHTGDPAGCAEWSADGRQRFTHAAKARERIELRGDVFTFTAEYDFVPGMLDTKIKFDLNGHRPSIVLGSGMDGQGSVQSPWGVTRIGSGSAGNVDLEVFERIADFGVLSGESLVEADGQIRPVVSFRL